jgi:hypothetical protein
VKVAVKKFGFSKSVLAKWLQGILTVWMRVGKGQGRLPDDDGGHLIGAQFKGPKGIVPFGRDPFGNLLGFDYRGLQSNPTVVFFDQEESEIYPVCNTFGELLKVILILEKWRKGDGNKFRIFI